MTPGSTSASTIIVTKPGTGPSVCDRIFLLKLGDPAGGEPCADASVATNPVSPQIAQDAKPENPRRVSMMTNPAISGSRVSGLLQTRIICRPYLGEQVGLKTVVGD